MPPRNQPQKNTKAVSAARPRGPRPQPAPKPTVLSKKAAPKAIAKPSSKAKSKSKSKSKPSNTRGKSSVKTQEPEQDPQRGKAPVKPQEQDPQRETSVAYSDVSYVTGVEDSDYLLWQEANPRVMKIPTNFVQDSTFPFVLPSVEGDDWAEELHVPVELVRARERVERLDMLARGVVERHMEMDGM